MKKVFKVACFQLASILFFTLVYHHFDRHFDFDPVQNTANEKLIDDLLLSTTIQCSIGISGLNPISTFGKFILIFHQLTVLFIHIITIYILNF
jgi:hypothetical protein